MAAILHVAQSNSNCIDCGFCKYFTCSWDSKCTGCGACVIGCPNNARELKETKENRRPVRLTIDGVQCEVPGQITILKTLELNGYKINHHHEHEEGIHAPCRTGGCGECSVLVDGVLKPSCVTPVKDGMEVITDNSVIIKYPPQRIASIFNKNLHQMADLQGINETSFFMHGCNMNCAACHNWDITFSSIGRPTTPDQLLQQLSAKKNGSGINRIGISGGEATLNRRWLVEFVKKVSMYASDGTRIQLDTNASILSNDYVDELIDAGVTDISPDLKGVTVGSFKKLTGLKDKTVAARYLGNAWQVVRYIIEQCADKLFTVVGIPFHKDLSTAEELYQIGKKLAAINPDVAVNLIEYQAAFRKRDLAYISEDETENSLAILQDAGLRNVLCQRAAEMPLAVHPLDLLIGEECGW
ncbi:radical SAM protein [Desulfoscipio geothermicus]|uniref:Pyruvate formate lyase activating enzyme n=1 Tax=Desulfoscipio geothermicus DSM 3669 TaxID=1121426 RepID=A0A1I6CQ87_9FIRM|nr:radical SAM protein [Desulfoscipio geothermicus]SFQ95366.1 pyruvate formate lyase activating enzyme [Desulfoscipio geothermicus DSM 3669]